MTAPTSPAPRRLRLALRRPPSRWLLVSSLLAGLAGALLLDGFVRYGHERSTTLGPGTPIDLPGAGPVLDVSGPEVRSAALPPRQVALTFDDGPDPRWTPRVLDVLLRHNARATFFVVGSRAIRYPDLVRRMVREGHEVANHTFTHADLAHISTWRANAELSLAESVIGGIVGRSTSLLRPPYSSTPSGLTAEEYRAARRAAKFGYLLVLATHDTKDWQRPGVELILQRATPSGDEGAVVLLHDAGGNRAQTVAAVDRLLARLGPRGYRFMTVSAVAGLPPAARVPTAARLQGRLLVGAVRLAGMVSGAVRSLLGIVLVLSALRVLFVLLFARRHARARRGRPLPSSLPPASVLVPAYNEELGIGATVRSLLDVEHQDIEVVVIDDGSTDATAAVVEELFGHEPRVKLVRQANEGKSEALNAGMRHATHDLLVMVDGDTVFERDTLTWLLAPFVDQRVGAVSGNAKVGNRRGLLGRWQHIEYVMGFNLDRRMHDVLGCMATVPGAVGGFRREALEQVGGLSDDTLAEDTDLTVAVNRAGWRVVYEERARAWTEAPATVGQLWRQRYRWSYGTLQALWKHRGAVRERSVLGLFGLPYLLVFQVMLPLLAPAVDLAALYGIVFQGGGRSLAYWAAFNTVEVALGVYAFRLDGERLRPLWALPFQQFAYRQIMYAVVVQSVISAVVGARLRWHKLTRTGDVTVGDVRV